MSNKSNSHHGPTLATNIKGFDVIDCRSCGYAHLNLVPSGEEQAEYYRIGFYETHASPDGYPLVELA